MGQSGVFWPSLISTTAIRRLVLKLACGLLYRAGLDHMINLQGRFVEMMAKQLCLVRHIVYLWTAEQFAQPTWKADLQGHHLQPSIGSMGGGATGHTQVCCYYQSRCSAAYSSTVVGEEASRRPCHRLHRGRPHAGL